ncbi:LANO_0E14488g1_1 [Lachancea nothofagi CBS 11611]|uniref:LANO_0E14488g1_1 n=1 Tax=Lachancea nothofagi CBS 11611 TaxID=1266666 RepID=A0A1G4K030_9SACH|nr:LANO_0E14488g1_1 [Lachancea nothofagi CBS 11611]
MTDELSVQSNYVDQLTKMLNHTKDDKTALLTLHRSLASSDDKAFAECLVKRPDRWTSIFAATREHTEDQEVVTAADFFMERGSSILSGTNDEVLDLKSFCGAVHTHLVVDTVVSQLLWRQCDAELEAQVVKSISGFLKCLMLLNESDPHSANAIMCDSFLTLKSGGYFTILTTVLESGAQYKGDIEEIAHSCVMDLATMDRSLNSRNVDKLPSSLMRSMVDLLDKHFKVSEWEKEKYPSVNEGGKQISELSLTNAIDMITFSTDSNLSFRKKFLERLLFEDDAFPIIKGLSWLSDQLSECFNQYFTEKDVSVFIMQCFLNKDILIFSLVDKLMELWIESKAQSFDDFKSVLETFKVAFFQHDCFLGAKEPDVGSCLVNIRSLTYTDLRSLQLKQIRTTHYEKWEKQISQFDSMLSNQVLEYVRHQRLLQLQKGSWVYSENPLDRSVKQPKVYFVVLSDNQMNLLAREFRARSEENPTVHGNEIYNATDASAPKSKTMVIPLRRVNKFQHWRVQSESKVPDNAKLINILNKAVYTEIHLLDKEASVLLRFFLDTKEASYIWLDGLQLIVAAALGKKPALSDDMKSQIANLIDLRKNVQIIGLDDNADLDYDDEGSEAEEQYYDLKTLQNLTVDFHYD